MNKKVKHGTLLTVIFTLLSLLYLYPIMFAMMMAAYLVVALLQFRKIKKIPMDQALKNVE